MNTSEGNERRYEAPAVTVLQVADGARFTTVGGGNFSCPDDNGCGPNPFPGG